VLLLGQWLWCRLNSQCSQVTVCWLRLSEGGNVRAGHYRLYVQDRISNAPPELADQMQHDVMTAILEEEEVQQGGDAVAAMQELQPAGATQHGALDGISWRTAAPDQQPCTGEGIGGSAIADSNTTASYGEISMIVQGSNVLQRRLDSGGCHGSAQLQRGLLTCRWLRRRRRTRCCCRAG